MHDQSMGATQVEQNLEAIRVKVESMSDEQWNRVLAILNEAAVSNSSKELTPTISVDTVVKPTTSMTESTTYDYDYDYDYDYGSGSTHPGKATWKDSTTVTSMPTALTAHYSSRIPTARG